MSELTAGEVIAWLGANARTLSNGDRGAALKALQTGATGTGDDTPAPELTERQQAFLEAHPNVNRAEYLEAIRHAAEKAGKGNGHTW